MTSSKNGDETEVSNRHKFKLLFVYIIVVGLHCWLIKFFHELKVRMRHNCIPMNLSSINEKLTKTQRAHIECTPFKWAMGISNNFSISGGLLWELVSRWDVRSRGFRVRDRIVPFTPVDVFFLLDCLLLVSL